MVASTWKQPRKSFAELRCWNLNSSWAWEFCQTLNGFGTSAHSLIDLLSPENKFEAAFDRQMLLYMLGLESELD